MSKLVTIALLSAFVVTQASCDRYASKPERLRSPKKKKRPDGAQTATSQELDEKCRTNFFAPETTRRRESAARGLTSQADKHLEQAYEADGADRVAKVSDALSKLQSALKKDPYGPLPTYKMAVAYAMVGKKGCALKLLERLASLENHAEAGPEATRVVRRALNDDAFDQYRKEADAALGN